MSLKYYDIAIIGGSLTACMTATLLAKSGNRVLFLRDQEAKAPAWFHSSLFLEKLLGVTGGRSCFIAPYPIQLMTEQARVTISHHGTLDDELARELGSEAPQVSLWLAQLREHGQQLEELFWENGGLPWPTFKASARFKLICLKHKINLNQFEIPVTEQLGDLSASATNFVVDLLQGLAVRSIDNLSYARAAMLWSQAMRPENLKEPEFSDILAKRFEQFHGSKASLEELDQLDYDGSQWTGGRFRSGARFTARNFLLGDRRWLKLFDVEHAQLQHAVYTPCAMKTTDLQGQLSTLLELRVICGGPFPMRIAMEEDNEQLRGLVLTTPDANEADVHRQLEPVLPFADYSLEIANQPQAATTPEQQRAMSLPFSSIPLRIAGNLYHADRTAVLPEMGAAGAALLAWTIYNNLSGKTKQEKV